jgi:hypothetical protein
LTIAGVAAKVIRGAAPAPPSAVLPAAAPPGRLSREGHVGSGEGGVFSFQGSNSCGKSVAAGLLVSDGLLKGIELAH